jgi:hypothetical protein
MFALPKLRELPFPLALVREPAQAAQVSDIPRTAGSAASRVNTKFSVHPSLSIKPLES